MAWQRIQKWQDREILRFFAEQEIQCVAASFRFQHFNPARDLLWGWQDREGSLRAILFFSGSVLHPLMDIHGPQGKDPGPFDNREALCSIVKKMLHFPCRRLRSIQGNDFLISLFDELVTEIGLFPRDTQEYLLMQFPLSAVRFSSNTQSPPEAPNRETLHFFWEEQQPNNHFYKELYKLQAAYEQEEVLPKGSPFDAASCRLTLDNILKHHLLVAVEKDGLLVAKANTNAWGFNHVQIGGVYVSPPYRNQGIAGRMLAHLIEKLQEHQKPITLFVKKRNLPARRLYEKLSFSYVAPPLGEYRISYY